MKGKLHALGDGSFLAIWTDHSKTGGDADGSAIRGQILNANGTKRGAEFLVNTTIADDQYDARAVVLSDGRFVVLWEDDGVQNYGIRARAYQADGTAIGNDFLVNDTDVARTGTFSAAALSDGGFAVAFQTVDDDVKVQSFAASLQRIENDVRIKPPQSDAVSALSPAIVPLQGRYAVFFKDFNDTGYFIHHKVLNNDGSPAGGAEFASAGLAEEQGNPVATTLINGQTVVVWEEYTYNAQNDLVSTLKAQVLNPDGSRQGAEIVVQSSTSEIWATSITHLADGGFAISYFLDEENSNSDPLYLATFNANGTRMAADFLVDKVYVTDDTALTTLADGRVVVAWDTWVSDLDNDGDGMHAQIVDPRQKAVSLSGLSQNDQYIGTRFHDTLRGNAGDDWLDGAEGKDTLRGDGGRDVFVFSTLANARTNKDKIVDFRTRDDSIWLDNAVFAKLGSRGTDAQPAQLKRAFFTIGDKAKDKNDYLIYDSRKGVLLYDADGSGKGKAVDIASLSKSLKMTYKDFFVI